MKIYDSLFFMTFLLIGCADESPSPITNLPSEVSFQLEQLNTNNDLVTYSTQVKNFRTKHKSSGWRLNGDGKIQLTREIMFDLELNNGDSVEFGFWFIKYENNKENLVLADEELYYGERDWDYLSTETEITNFYKGFDEARILINSNVIFHKSPNENFQIVSVEEGVENGETKSFVTIQFEGTAFGFYDPNGEYQEVFKFTDGVFKGVIE